LRLFRSFKISINLHCHAAKFFMAVKIPVEEQPVPNNDAQPIATGLRAAKAVARDRGISDVTLWRWHRRKWIKTVNICGKNYVDLQSLADFDRRAATGEFAKAPAGAAGASSKARAEREASE
jgi:hypothetical protein